jgi:hypothetical protein
MAVISISYVEPDVTTYENVNISCNNGIKQKFDSGNFIIDWYNAIKYCVINLDEIIMFSSSVNHFITDGKLYDSAYLFIIDDKPVFKYDDYNGIEHFVPKGMKYTWEEYKKLVS